MEIGWWLPSTFNSWVWNMTYISNHIFKYFSIERCEGIISSILLSKNAMIYPKSLIKQANFYFSPEDITRWLKYVSRWQLFALLLKSKVSPLTNITSWLSLVIPSNKQVSNIPDDDLKNSHWKIKKQEGLKVKNVFFIFQDIQHRLWDLLTSKFHFRE